MADKSEITTVETGAHFQELTQDEFELTAEARRRMDIGLDGVRWNYDEYREDVAFLDGEGQWTHEAKEIRGTDRPMLTINKLPAHIDQAIGEARQNRISTHVVATSNVGNEEMTTRAGKQMSRADAFGAIIRDVEQQTTAEDAYDTALETVYAGGVGYWIVGTEYVDDDVFEQRICVDRVIDPTLVVPDPSATKADRSDMNWCFVLDWMQRKEFDSRYPGMFPAGDLNNEFLAPWVNWFRQTDDHVSVAEYWRRIPVQREILLLSNGTVMDATAQKEIVGEVLATGLKVVQSREVRSHKVEWYRIGGTRILEGPVEFPCRWIPVVTVVGKELAVAGRIKTRGMVRHAKDAQRAYNYWRTAMTESAALQPKAPYIAAAEQVEDHLNQWEKANSENSAVLLYSAIPNVPPPQRDRPPEIAPAFVQETISADNDIKATVGGSTSTTVGQPDASKQSGVAIAELRQTQSTNTFTFTDNLKRAIRHTGRIFVDMIPRIYDTRRVLRLLHEDESEDFLELFAPVIDEETNKEVLINDLSGGRLGVYVKVGPSFATQRQAALAGVFAFLERDPEAAPLVRDLIAGNLDFPGAKMLADRLRKTIPEELLEGERGDEGEERPPSAAQKTAAVLGEAELATAEAKVGAAEAKEAQEKIKLMELMKEAGLDREALLQLIQATVQEMIQDQTGDPNMQTPPDQIPPGVTVQ
jgi:hypothetical protein